MIIQQRCVKTKLSFLQHLDGRTRVGVPFILTEKAKRAGFTTEMEAGEVVLPEIVGAVSKRNAESYAIKLEIAYTAEYKKVIVSPSLDFQMDFERIVHAVNLFLEIFGFCIMFEYDQPGDSMLAQKRFDSVKCQDGRLTLKTCIMPGMLK